MLADAPHHSPDVLLLATGNEVTLCIAAYEQLKAEGIQARVNSTPSWELLESQNQEYRDSVLPPEITARVAVEAASSTLCWRPLTLSPQPENKCCVTLRIMELGMRTFKYDNQSDPTIRQLQHSVNDGAGAALAGRAADCEARYMPRQ